MFRNLYTALWSSCLPLSTIRRSPQEISTGDAPSKIQTERIKDPFQVCNPSTITECNPSPSSLNIEDEKRIKELRATIAKNTKTPHTNEFLPILYMRFENHHKNKLNNGFTEHETADNEREANLTTQKEEGTGDTNERQLGKCSSSSTTKNLVAQQQTRIIPSAIY